ncbi:unnamed protein product [Arctogadus glacialis]
MTVRGDGAGRPAATGPTPATGRCREVVLLLVEVEVEVEVEVMVLEEGGEVGGVLTAMARCETSIDPEFSLWSPGPRAHLWGPRESDTRGHGG